MPAVVEIDKAGRLVIPKQIRDALHLYPGSSLGIELRGDEIVLRPQSSPLGLYEQDGLLVFDGGVPLTAEDVNRWLYEDRERRTRHLLGEP